MRKPGKSSRERNADFCSNHNDDEDKYLFKVLVGDFRERLVIPDKFEQHFRGLIANSVKLESRCGYTFDVEVAKNLGKVVLQTGWKEFVTAHDLNMGDLLVLRNSIYPEDQKLHCQGYILPRKTRLTCVQMKKLKERVRANSSTIPIYGCIITKSNIHGKMAMDIPRVYADVYLPFEDQTLMLQCCGKSWEVRCVVRNKRRTKRLVKGWNQFARDNKLQLGDLCLFELLENMKHTMNVHIIRALL
ncbi:unnamed protein product [Miscanthus lutarioriparius]|uniref:TF-B3 domain-containing protein n=1 Tax=Miscanthus lutarioriparius TaxID=422564 RepID=A0A811MU66_9POAL|nr:unnamed protein product [Miscanthus lutarioriparius]